MDKRIYKKNYFSRIKEIFKISYITIKLFCFLCWAGFAIFQNILRYFKMKLFRA